MTIDELAKRYRLGEEISFEPDGEYGRDVWDMINDMHDKPRGRGRSLGELGQSTICSKALEHCMRVSIPGCELIPFEKGKNWGADVLDTVAGNKIDVKTQDSSLVTWKPWLSDLQNLLNTHAVGEVSHVLTGDCWKNEDWAHRRLMTAVFFQVIPIELVFRGRPEKLGENVEEWINWKWFKKMPETGNQRALFKNDLATSAGLSARKFTSSSGNPSKRERVA